MGFFSVFRHKKNNTSEIELIPLEDIKEKLSNEESYEDMEIVPISVNGVIDTNNPDNINRYKHNVNYLRNNTKVTGNTGDMVIIRNDDIFPEGFVWRENSDNTYGELGKSKITYQIKKYILDKKFNGNNEFGFAIPGDDHSNEYQEELKKFDKDFARIVFPTKFRTTKHFTINTPLGYTGSYNQVDSNRKYTILDDASSLIESPYTYTISGKDAYLDVTHEGLPISENAIILISEEYFNEIKNNKELLSKLNERHLMVYKGDINIAINMLLSESGHLPYRPGLGIPFDSEVENIIETNFRELCSTYGYEYDKGHGNLFGEGGHFSDLIDNRYNTLYDEYASFIDFINLNSDVKITNEIINDDSLFTKFIDSIGVDTLLTLIENYNKYMFSYFDAKRKEYISTQDNIPVETLELFRTTVKNINTFYRDARPSSDTILWEMVFNFYTDSNIDNQVDLANLINEYINTYGRTSNGNNSR